MSSPDDDGAHRGVVTGRPRVVILARFTLMIATSYLLLGQVGATQLPTTTAVLVLVGFLSNVAALRLPPHVLTSARFQGVVMVVDALWVTATLLSTGRFESDFFLLYFFVVVIAALGENLVLIGIGLVAVVVGYALLVVASAGADALLQAGTLVRIPFLLTVAIFFGYLVDQLRQERERLRDEQLVARRLERGQRVLARANDELAREVEERKRVERELRTMSLAVEHSPDGVLVVRRDGSVAYANPRASELARTGGGDGRDGGDGIAAALRRSGADEVATGPLLEALAAGDGWSGELPTVLPGEPTTWIAASAVPIGGGRRSVVVLSDVTDRKRAEGTLRRANDELHRLNEMKSALISTVSHELRTPLTAMTNAVDLLGRALGDPERQDRQHQLHDVATRNTRRLKTLVDDLLDLARLESGRAPLELREVEAGPLIEALAASFIAQAEASAVELRVRVGDRLPPAWADPGRVEQIAGNLIGNALKFGGRGSVVEVAVAAAGDGVEIAVRDEGPGISEEDLQRIFEPFFQAGDPLTRREKGSGLGLAIARDLARAHGGELEVHSRLGEGTRFTFRLLAAGRPAALELLEFEAEMRKLRRYPFFGVLVIEPPADVEVPDAAVDVVRERIRTLLPRSLDLVVAMPASRRVAVVLPSTPRDGGRVVRRKIEEALRERPPEIDGRRVTAWTVAGPSVFPEDGETGGELLERAAAARGRSG